MSYGGALWEQVLVRGVGILAVLVVLERLQRGILLLWVPGREVMGILHRTIKSALALWKSKICPSLPSAGLDMSYLGGLEAFLARQFGLFVEGDRGELLIDASVVRRLELHGVHFGNRDDDGLDSGRGHVVKV